MSEIVNVTITAPDAAWLADLTRRLIDARLAASGNITENVRSIYRWNESVHEASEASVSLRTQSHHVPAIIETTKSTHPYEVPHVVAMPVADSNPDYRQWIIEATNNDEPA